jgi:hypothetical protein
VRIPSAVTPDTAQPAGICPSPGGDHLPIGPDQVTAVRLTALAPGDPPRFVCDYMIPVTGGGNTQEILIPDQSPRVDILLDAFGDVAAGETTRPLLYQGEQRGVVAAGGSAEVLLLRPLAFGCLPAHLNHARAFHSATALPDGSVLVAGGVTGFSDATRQQLAATEAIEVYDPRTRTFFVPQDRRPQKIPRAFHQAIALPSATDGKFHIMLIGGITPAEGDASLSVAGLRRAAEPLRVMPLDQALPAGVEMVVFDPVARTIDSLAAETAGFAPRMFAAVTTEPGMLADLAIAGGIKKSGATFDPANAALSIDQADRNSGTLLSGGAMAALSEQRVGGSLTPLSATDALVFGGDMSAPATMEAAHSAEKLGGIGTASVTSTALLVPTTTSVVPTAFHTATLLSDGSVAIIGGFQVQAGVAINTNDAAALQRIKPDAMNNLTATAVPLGGFVGVGYHATLAVPDANALLVSGGSPAMSSQSCGLFCSSQGAYLIDWTSMMIRSMHTLAVGRYGHEQSLLADGTVLVTGGMRRQPDKNDMSALLLDSVEVFNPHDASFDRVNLAPLGLMRPAGSALGDMDPTKRCLTRAEYKKTHNP